VPTIVPLFYSGAKVSASDISDAMANEAGRRAKEMGITNANFYASDLESVTGSYSTVTCVDVAIHYPTEKMTEMITHLCSLAQDRVIISFAPKTWYYVALKKVGEFFPGPSKTTRAYLHEEEVVRKALNAAGFELARDEMTATNLINFNQTNENGQDGYADVAFGLGSGRIVYLVSLLW
jgi:magnesium-protoporphyrin O-methyltransferase